MEQARSDLATAKAESWRSKNSSAWFCDPPQSRRWERTAVGAGCDFDKLAQLDAEFADCETHVLRWELVELGGRFLVERACAFEVSALGVQDRDSGLDQSLVVEFHLAVRALPDFFPRFVAFEEAALVEKIDSLFVEIHLVFHSVEKVCYPTASALR